MNDNVLGILSQLVSNYNNYENHVSRKTMTPHEVMLDILEEEYCRFCNHDDWLAALKGMFSEAECELFAVLPKHDRHEIGITLAEAKTRLRPEIAAQAESLAASLVEKRFVFEDNGRYQTTYLLYVLGDGILDFHGTPLDKACLDWWRKIVYDSSESKKLRTPRSVFRVIPHEGTLTGDPKHGKIPMNIEIPDTRQVMEFDRLSEVLSHVRRFAVVDCICRKANDDYGDRQCDQPLEVCLLFNEDADAGIEDGARELTYEEAMEIIKDCRNRGLVQAMSNDYHPLALCNCCTCCCVYLNNNFRGENLCDDSRFVIDVAHQENCIQCGICAKKCPADVLDVHETYIGLNTTKCVGCGVCASQCPKGVLQMIPRPGAEDVTYSEELLNCYL